MTPPWLRTGDEDLLKSCADAVLRLDDGSLIPCSRYVMSCSCPVLAAMVELEAPVHDDGCVIIPVPDTGRDRYEAFVRVAHGVTAIADLPAAECLGVFRCADFVGSDAIMDAAMRAAWAAAPRPKTVHALPVVPRLLESGGEDARDVVRHACADHPLWPNVLDDFLGHIGHELGPAGLRALLAFQNFYPPAAVAMWAMRRRVMTEDIAMDLATFDEYAPRELAAVCTELLRWYPIRNWINDPVTRLLGAIGVSLTDFEEVPVPVLASGYRIDFQEHRFVVAAWVPPRHKRTSAPFELSKLLRARLPLADAPFGFELHVGRLFREVAHAPRSVQVRLTASRCASMALPVYDSWYVIPLDTHGPDSGWVDAGAAWREIGHVTEALRAEYRRGLHLRFDVRYAATAAMDLD